MPPPDGENCHSFFSEDSKALRNTKVYGLKALMNFVPFGIGDKGLKLRLKVLKKVKNKSSNSDILLLILSPSCRHFAYI